MKRDTGTTGMILAVAVFLILACGSTGPRRLDLYATATATVTVTPLPTSTSTLITQTATALPSPTSTPLYPRSAVVEGHWNCHIEADRNSPVVAYPTSGEKVVIVTEVGGWARISYKEQMCYIVSAALK